MVGHRHLEVVWSRDQPFTPWEAALAGLSWLSKLTEGSTSPPANSVVLPGFLHGRLPWLPSPHACLACMHSRWSHALICLNMTSEVVLLYRNDEHISSHIDEGQSFEEPTDEPNFEGWPSSWNSVEDSSIHVSNNPWEQPSFGYVSEQPPMYGGSSSSQHAYTDDGGYIPQIDYTSITGSSFHPEQMHGTPPSMQMDDQWFNDEQTPDPP
ncbi:hypothetical protein V6N13_055699 [Hibiscus sabdariffa]